MKWNFYFIVIQIYRVRALKFHFIDKNLKLVSVDS